MLTISLNRLSDLLEKAAEIDLTLPISTDDDEAGATAADQLVIEDIVDETAYRDLLQSLEALPPDEQYDLIALGLLARSDAGLDEWQAMLEQARALRGENILDELARMMLLTDEIETALDRLGIDLDGNDLDDDNLDDDADEQSDQDAEEPDDPS